MNAPVSVTAVLDAEIDMHRNSLPEFQAELDAAIAARANINELIEATTALCDAIEFRIDDPRNAMRDRVVMALARVGATA